jgi:low temperature requirement protein LtrA
MFMPNVAIVCGALLILIGITGYTSGVMSDKASITALIPAFFGIVLNTLGLLAKMKEDLRKHLMHAAILVALVGFIAAAGRLVLRFGELSMTPAVISQIAMAIVCLIFVILAIKSFADARRAAESI